MKKCKYCKLLNTANSKINKIIKIIIIVLIVIFCIVGCVGACSKGINDAIEETTNSKDNLRLEENTVTASKDEYGISYNIEGYIKNNSDKAFNYVQITYTTYDAEGNTIGTCLDNNSGLDANGRWKFKAICTSDVDNIASYKMTDITAW